MKRIIKNLSQEKYEKVKRFYWWNTSEELKYREIEFHFSNPLQNYIGLYKLSPYQNVPYEAMNNYNKSRWVDILGVKNCLFVDDEF